MADERSSPPNDYERTEHQSRPIINEFTGEFFAYDATAPQQDEPNGVAGRTNYLSGEELLVALECWDGDG